MSLFKLTIKQRTVVSGNAFEKGMTINVPVRNITNTFPWNQETKDIIVQQFKTQYGLDAKPILGRGPAFFMVEKIS